VTGVTPQGTADPNVTRGQGGNLGDSNSDLWCQPQAAPTAPFWISYKDFSDWEHPI
jgi:hypothetical protein